MPVLIQGVDDSIKRTLLTTTGDIIAASAVSTPSRIAAPASGQVLTGQGVGVLPAWAAAGGAGALTRVGGNTTEATTTSTTVVDLLTVSGLTIAANVPVLIIVLSRKTDGAAAAAGFGLKVNATEIATPTTAGSFANNPMGMFNANNRVENGQAVVWIPALVASYINMGVHSAVATWQTTGGAGVEGRGYSSTAIQPNAQRTDLIVNAISGSALITIGADEMHIYTYAVS